MKDKYNRKLENGSIIDLHQTVNGQNIFIVLTLEPLDVRYGHDLTYKYEYDVNELFAPCKYRGEPEFEIINNIYDLLPE